MEEERIQGKMGNGEFERRKTHSVPCVSESLWTRGCRIDILRADVTGHQGSKRGKNAFKDAIVWPKIGLLIQFRTVLKFPFSDCANSV